MSGDEHGPGLRIARARRRRGLSQAVLADLAHPREMAKAALSYMITSRTSAARRT
jgi:hypothetical protein